MIPIGALLGLPVVVPIAGLGWIARQIAEAALAEFANPDRVREALFALETALERGEIDETTYEAREAELLERLQHLQPEPEDAQALAGMQAEIDAIAAATAAGDAE